MPVKTFRPGVFFIERLTDDLFSLIVIGLFRFSIFPFKLF